MVFLLTLITAGSFGGFLTLTIDEPGHEVAFVASDTPAVPLYIMTEDGLSDAGSIVRGTMIEKYKEAEEIDGKSYSMLVDGSEYLNDISEEEKDADFYIASDNLSPTRDKSVRESEVFIRTPAKSCENSIQESWSIPRDSPLAKAS